MNLKTLRKFTQNIISNLKDHGKYPKENDSIDYKKELKLVQDASPLEIFLVNFAGLGSKFGQLVYAWALVTKKDR
ncbi:MAG: hypothetical protein D3923_14295 [Candidatus Electrothrix sp. AR3]|nr:hypothetical protein [Candidatus Electrothrix sp. AR3]